MKTIKKIISIVLAFTMLVGGVTIIYADEMVTVMMPHLEELLVTTGDVEEELLPMAANNCIPSNVYAAYNVITTYPGGADFYTHHEYENEEKLLPGGTTYTTYYIQNSSAKQTRLVIGADGSAYYFPSHYGKTFYKLDV